MTWDTGNPLRAPVLTLDASILHHAKASVQRVTALAGFNNGNIGHANVADMKRLRGDAAEAVDVVEEAQRKDMLGIPCSVRDNLLNALSEAKSMLEDPDIRPALDQAYAPQFVHETVRQLDEAYGQIDAILNPPKVEWRETPSGELQGAFEF